MRTWEDTCRADGASARLRQRDLQRSARRRRHRRLRGARRRSAGQRGLSVPHLLKFSPGAPIRPSDAFGAGQSARLAYRLWRPCRKTAPRMADGPHCGIPDLSSYFPIFTHKEGYSFGCSPRPSGDAGTAVGATRSNVLPYFVPGCHAFNFKIAASLCSSQ